MISACEREVKAFVDQQKSKSSFVHGHIEAASASSGALMKKICQHMDPELVKEAALTTLTSDLEEQNQRYMARNKLHKEVKTVFDTLSYMCLPALPPTSFPTSPAKYSAE